MFLFDINAALSSSPPPLPPQISRKFGWQRGLADKALEMLKSKQIEEAKKQHEDISNNLYEL